MPRVNFMIDDEIMAGLESVPRGERSRAVNEALAQWLVQRRRQVAARRMDQLRSGTPGASTADITRWIRKDRERK